MSRTVRAVLMAVALAVAFLFGGACRDPVDLPVPDPQPVRPFR